MQHIQAVSYSLDFGMGMKKPYGTVEKVPTLHKPNRLRH